MSERYPDAASSVNPVPMPSVRSRPIGDREINAVDARELHAALDVRRDFTSWIKSQISGLSLRLDQDYVVFTEPGENPRGGRPRAIYVLTLEVAKHVAMASRTDRGRRVREYFLECERRALVPMSDEAMELLVFERLRARARDAEERLRLAEHTIETQRPAVELLDRFQATREELLVSTVCKQFDLHSRRVFSWLREGRHAFDRDGVLQAGTGHLRAGRMVMRRSRRPYTDAAGRQRFALQLRLTPKGQVWLLESLPDDCRKTARQEPRDGRQLSLTECRRSS